MARGAWLPNALGAWGPIPASRRRQPLAAVVSPPHRARFPPPRDTTIFLDFLRFGHSSLPSADPLLPSAFQPKESHLHPPPPPPEDPVAASEATTGAQIHALEPALRRQEEQRKGGRAVAQSRPRLRPPRGHSVHLEVSPSGSSATRGGAAWLQVLPRPSLPLTPTGTTASSSHAPPGSGLRPYYSVPFSSAEGEQRLHLFPKPLEAEADASSGYYSSVYSLAPPDRGSDVVLPG
ncbi:hypothetical protein U9M48_036449 [Paspalum notatum var. saurae]|uniref:Uncharacterized protein n=1 Tax=Paspalum notatum var. saurae TaxID=547442 RepID=A0AAQ3UD64_PASNO